MTRTAKQKRLLLETLAHIEADKEHWDQGVWRFTIDHDQPLTRCNTAMCFAGWAAQIDGCRWSKDEPEMLLARKDDPDHESEALVHVRARAQRILGLSNYEADDLFYHGNRLDHIRQMVKELTR